MSSTSASILIGRLHQNDGDIIPTHLAQLHEGDRAAWTLHSLTGSSEGPVTWRPDRPDIILETMFALVAVQVLQSPRASVQLRRPTIDIDESIAPMIADLAAECRTARGLAVAATIFPGSSLQAEQLISLTEFDVQIASVTYSRTWSAWTNDWVVDDGIDRT